MIEALNEWAMSLDFTRLPELLTYSPERPLIFSSSLFFLLFLGFLPLYGALRRTHTLRIIYVVLFSLYFYYMSSGWFVLLLIAMVTSDFLIGKAIYRTSARKKKKWLVALSITINLTILGFFKYFNFLGGLACNLLALIGNECGIDALSAFAWRDLPIFLPVGISFFTFQTMSYIIDLGRGKLAPLKRWIDYLFYVSFFPQLVAGPIVRARDFIPQIHRTTFLSRGAFGKGLYLVLIGLFKKAIISDYISINFVDRVFDAPALYSGLENLIAAYGYTLQIYCDFSGYSDMAIGIALFLGFRFRKNFDLPFNSASITEFWRRWHISLSTWLKDYLYIPLGGNRKGKFRTYINLLITMFLGGLWHGAALRFILWGTMHGVMLALDKIRFKLFPRCKVNASQMKPGWRILSVLLTFHFVVFAFLFFRAKDVPQVWTMMNQICLSFHPELFLPFLEGYLPVALLILCGFVLHFLPRGAHRAAERALTRAPFAVQLLLFVALVVLVSQVKSANVQPFIYFQF